MTTYLRLNGWKRVEAGEYRKGRYVVALYWRRHWIALFRRTRAESVVMVSGRQIVSGRTASECAAKVDLNRRPKGAK